MSNFTKTMLGVLSVVACSASSAGSFETWTMDDAKSNRTTLVVSFTGDGATQEAQLDLEVPAGLVLAKAIVKVAGSVCAGVPGNKIRIVPPSGAGEALPSRAIDYCSFSFKSSLSVMAKAKPQFKVTFQECATTTKAEACSYQASDVTN